MATKHVIFLGAGASVTSGYPDARKLRHMLSDPEFLMVQLQRAKFGLGHETYDLQKEMTAKGYLEAMDIFRCGAFGTVDEFCSLAQGKDDYRVAIDLMKRLTRLVLFSPSPEVKLSSLSPEVNYLESDYYAFVQRLFNSAALHKLRNEITVLSFNYDPYLEFVLMRAAQKRGKIAGVTPGPDALNAMTGGFYDRATWKHTQEERFCLLKLHGSIASPTGEYGYDKLFTRPTHERVWNALRKEDPPLIYFPWELFDANSQILPKGKFPKMDSEGLAHSHFEATWVQARTACMGAEKISFVGISMHEFLKPGLEFLFKDRSKPPTVLVVANIDAEISNQYGAANSFTRTKDMLQRVMGGECAGHYAKVLTLDRARVQRDFSTFIQQEMD